MGMVIPTTSGKLTTEIKGGTHMTTHVIEVEVRRFYKVYVDDENDTMTEAEAEQQARKQLEENGMDALSPDLELENDFEMDDVLDFSYDYPIL